MPEEELKCFKCGKTIDCLAEAPSGSYLPRCNECNAKRWHQVDPIDYDEDIDGEDNGEWGI